MAEENRRIVVQIDAELEEIVPGFLENKRKEIPRLRSALKEADFETIRILAHSMKGAGGGYGFDAITEIGASLEQAAKGKDPGEILKRIDELNSYIERVEVVFK